MVISDNNKGSFFYFELDLPNLYGIESRKVEQDIETNVDIILANLGATGNMYKFKSNEKFIYLFSTRNRKRKGQLNKLIEKNLLEKNLIESYYSVPFLKTEFIDSINKLKEKKSLKLVNEPTVFEGYSGKDLEVFKNKENWYPWQKEVYKKLFHESGEIKTPDPRHIITLFDEEGNSGKSSFFKYLYFHHSDDIGRITYGTASQLRSSIINIGVKKIYIIDLTRSKSKHDSEIDLLSAIEDLKNGVVSSNMYGSGNTLLMDIPNIIISANYIFDQSLLSKDRWRIFSINHHNLKDITEKVKIRQFQNEIITK
jgi:hypothetical protein